MRTEISMTDLPIPQCLHFLSELPLRMSFVSGPGLHNINIEMILKVLRF